MQTTSGPTAKTAHPDIAGPVHFIGLCGAGMSAVARLCQQKGWTVTGSDEGFYPPISDVVKGYKIPCATRYDPANIPPDTRTVVLGRHAKLVPETNLEVAEAFRRQRQGRLAVVSFPEVLRDIVADSTALVVAGSYGKSTCSALASWVLRCAGLDPGWFVGAEVPCLGANGNLGAGDVFVLEGDEYPAILGDPRSKFAFYPLRHLLLTSCEHDHVNVFPTQESYLAPFRELATRVPVDGSAVACAGAPFVDDVLSHCTGPVVRYGLSPGPGIDWWATDLRVEDGTTRFTIVHAAKPICDVATSLLGNHNIENLVGVAAATIGTGLTTPASFANAISTFTGIRRRLERVTAPGCLPVYNDFGSSRAKCRAGIDALLAAYPDRRLIACFEPHTFSFRNRDALSWYDDLFAGAHRVLVFPPPDHGAATHDQLGVDEITERIRRSGVHTTTVASADALLTELDGLHPDRDIVVFETSGGFDGAIPRVAAWASKLRSEV